MNKVVMRIISVMCILSVILSNIAIATVNEDKLVDIISAEYDVYNGEIRVLADVPSECDFRIFASENELEFNKSVVEGYILFVSCGYIPNVYGIVPIKLEAICNKGIYIDTCNIEVERCFEKNEIFFEDFDELLPCVMSDANDPTTANAVRTLNNGQIKISGMPSQNYGGRYLDIVNNNIFSTCLNFRFHSSADKSLPSIVVNPVNDAKSGVVELSYSFLADNPFIRQTIYPVSRAYNSAMTFKTSSGSVFASSFRVVNYETFCFGSSNKKLETGKFYDIRFLLNLNELSFDLYVNDELVDYGEYTYNDSRIAEYIYGVDRFDLACGVQGIAGATSEKAVNVMFDDIKITQADTGASISKIEYLLDGEKCITDVCIPQIPFSAKSIFVYFDNAVSLENVDISLLDSDGNNVSATVNMETSKALSAVDSRTVVKVTPESVLDVGELYKIVIPVNMKYSGISYDKVTEIPFTTSPHLALISPLPNTRVKQGTELIIKACVLDAEFTDLYINGQYVSTLYSDENGCVTHTYNTASLPLGSQNIELSLFSKDGTSKQLSTTVNTTGGEKTDILPIADFESDSHSDYFTVVNQASADSAAMLFEKIDNRNAAAFYFLANSNTNRKVIMVRKQIDEIVTGRIVLEFDMYLADENKNAELSISYSDDIYTYYPLDTAKQFKSGKINNMENNYAGWHSVKFIMDTVSQSSEMYFDGIKIGNTCYTFENTYHKSDVPPPETISGFNAFTVSLWQSQSYESGKSYLGLALDNWHVYREEPCLSVNSATVYSDDGNIMQCTDGSVIPHSANKFKLYISDVPYYNLNSLIENFKFYSDDILLGISNIVFSDNCLSFDTENLSPNSELRLVFGENTLLYDNVTTCGSDYVFKLKMADLNGLYHKANISYDEDEVKAFMFLDALESKEVSLIVAAYSYDKLVSFKHQKQNIDTECNLSMRVPGSSITGAMIYIWNSFDAVSPQNASHFAGTGAAGSNTLGLKSVFETESTALKYIDNAIIFKEDTDFIVFESQKHKYDELPGISPYTDENGIFMVSADMLSNVFGEKITVTDSSILIGEKAVCEINSDIAYGNEGSVYKLESPIVAKGKSICIPLRSFAVDILGYTYLYDRGMHIFDTEEFPYTNSPSTFETKEPIDAIYRFMQFEKKSAESVYSKMDNHLGGNIHPRILTDTNTLTNIKERSMTDPIVSKAFENTLEIADSYINEPCVEYSLPDGKRLLVAAREVMERLVNLSSAYLVTNDDKYADRAWIEMENCFSWKDWNTAQHYLDNSELLYGVSVAFDSLYNYLSKEQKNIIMNKTWELSLKHTVDRYRGINFSGSEWRTARSNWGFVCNGAVISAILAFGRENNVRYQPYYDFLLECALKAIEYPIMLYYPDGAWEEGMAYWEYSLRYFVGSVLVPLYFSTGSTFDYMLPQGVDKIANMGLYMQSGSYGFNFSDNADEGMKSCETVYAFAMLRNDDTLMQTWKEEMTGMNATHGARTLMWYRPSEEGNVSSVASLPKDFFFKGVEVGSMKEEWNSQDSSVVFFKGGQNNTNGSHLDVGTFCFDTMGKRWSVDLGKDSYNIEGGYNGLAGWELYVKRPEGHNCVVINPRSDISGEYYGGQYLNGRAEIIKMFGSENEAYSVVDLSDAYKYDANSYLRGFFLGDGRRTLVVQDEFELKEDNSSIYWFMHTRAQIEIDDDGKGAYLTHGEKSIRVDFVTNAQNARFVINSVGEDIQRFPTDPIRPGQLYGGRFTSVKVLTIEAVSSGDTYITVKLSPVDEKVDEYSSVAYKPISLW